MTSLGGGENSGLPVFCAIHYTQDKMPALCKQACRARPNPIVGQLLLLMHTIYKPGDQVVTIVKGTEVEASVVRVSVEVEVKTTDGGLWWRAVSRVRPAVGESPVSAEQVEALPEKHDGETAAATEMQREDIFSQSEGELPQTAAKAKRNKRSRKG